MNQNEKSQMNSFKISIKSSVQDKKFFVFKDKKFEFDFLLFKQNSNFFLKYQNQYENVNYIYLLQDDEVMIFDDISDNAIINFIKLSQNETCEIANCDIFYIQFLAQKYLVIELITIISNLISTNYNHLIFDSFIFKTKTLYDENKDNDLISYFSDKDISILSYNLANFVNDERIFNLPIPILYQILNRRSILIQQGTNENILIIEFLFKCLDKFGRNASVLFENINFGSEKIEFMKRLLSEKYSKIFDFHFINTSYHKTIFDMQNEFLEKEERIKIEQDQIKSENISIKNEMKKIKTEKNEQN